MRLLVSCNRTKLAAKMDLNFLRQAEALREFADVFFHGEGWDAHEGETVGEAAARWRPDLVYFADLDYVDLRGAEAVRVPRAILYEDPWGDVDRRLSALDEHGFEILVTKYQVGLEVYRARHPRMETVIHPHGYNPDVFRPAAPGKTWDVLLCGREDETYPERTRLKAIGRSLAARGYRVLDHPHSGYWDIGEPRRDDGQATLAALASASRVSIAGTGPLRSHVAKLWELPATASLCFTDLNTAEPDCHRLRTHVWAANMAENDERIADSLERCVAASESMAPIAAERVGRYATLRDRARELVESFEMILGPSST